MDGGINFACFLHIQPPQRQQETECVSSLCHNWAFHWRRPRKNLTKCHPVIPTHSACRFSFSPCLLSPSLLSDAVPPSISPSASHYSYLGCHESLLLLFILRHRPYVHLLPLSSPFSLLPLLIPPSVPRLSLSAF